MSFTDVFMITRTPSRQDTRNEEKRVSARRWW